MVLSTTGMGWMEARETLKVRTVHSEAKIKTPDACRVHRIQQRRRGPAGPENHTTSCQSWTLLCFRPPEGTLLQGYMLSILSLLHRLGPSGL